MATYDVRAHWDAEAKMWWAESDDVPGLVAEADTHDGLLVELRAIVPELLELNVPGRDRSAKTVLRVISDAVEEVLYA